MARAATSRRKVGSKENFFGFLTDKKTTYHRDVAAERRHALASERDKAKARELVLKKAQQQEKKRELQLKRAEQKERKAKLARKRADQRDRNIEAAARKKQWQAEVRGEKREGQSLLNPAKSAAQYRLAQAVLSGTVRGKSKMSRKVAQEIVDRTPAKLRSEFMKANSRKKRKKGKRNPEADAKALSEKFHGRPATQTRVVTEKRHVHKHLMEIGPLVRLVIDTPTGIVAVLNFNTKDPKKIVYLASSEKDPKTGELVGKQLYLRGGDQEVNLKGLGMDSALWIRDRMELGRLHEFKRGDEPLIVNGETVKGSITYRTRKGHDDFKLIDYWHRAGEETSRTAGLAARPVVVYDYRNKKLEFVGGQYTVREEGIVN